MDGMHHPGSYSARLAPMTWKLCAKQALGIRCCAALSRLTSQIAGLAVGNVSLFPKVRESEKKEKKKVIIIVRQDCPCCRSIKEKADLMVPCQPSARTSCREYPTEAHS